MEGALPNGECWVEHSIATDHGIRDAGGDAISRLLHVRTSPKRHKYLTTWISRFMGPCSTLG